MLFKNNLNISPKKYINDLKLEKSKKLIKAFAHGAIAKGFEPGSKFIFGENEIEIYEDGSAHLVESKGLAG